MEKLEAKHDHKLTDILKVAIFGLMLILPGLILLPSMLYYGVNEYATAPTEQVEKIEYKRVNFNQLRSSFDVIDTSTTTNDDNEYIIVNGSFSERTWIANTNYISFYKDHKYLCKTLGSLVVHSPEWEITFSNSNEIATCPNDLVSSLTIEVFASRDVFSNDYFSVCIFDLTQMFGVGNEPTLQEFNSYYPNDYYEYTESRYEILEIPTGTYETYTDITSQIQYNWNSLWQQPLFSWTNYTILKQGLDNFTYVFGITQTSYINNLITYELIMVAIYIVIDIVLTLFKWLTHLIGEK